MSVEILQGSCLDILPTLATGSVQCVVTSPPYWGLRDYGVKEQLGLEDNFEDFVAGLEAVFDEVYRVLKPDGVLWLNMGDSYSSGSRNTTSFRRDRANCLPPCPKAPFNLPPKNLIGQPWRIAFALQARGWILRSDIIWHKPSAMPESITDRPTKAHEYVFLFSKQRKYFYNADAIREPHKENSLKRCEPHRADPGRSDREGKASRPGGGANTLALADMCHPGGANARTVWTIPSAKYKEAHFATFPPALAERCIKAGSRPGDMVLDPFGGAGTTGLVADRLERNATLIEVNPDYVELSQRRIKGDSPLFAEVK